MTETFPSCESARDALRRWQGLLPEASDAHQPSGVVPFLAYPLMIVGALVGVVASILTAAAVVGVGTFFVYGVSAVAGFVLSLPIVFYVVALVLFGIGIVGAFLFWGATYFTLGAVSGLAVSFFATKGKNRGTLASGAAGTLAAAVSVAGLFLLVQWVAWSASGTIATSHQDAFGRGLPGLADYHFGALAWANGALGMGVAVIVGALTGSIVDRFCESCGVVMDLEVLVPTSLDAAQRMLVAIGRQDSNAEVDVDVDVDVHGDFLTGAYDPADSGDGPVRVSVSRCPRCGNGYLDLNVTLEIPYQRVRDPSPRTVSESWRCASTPIPAAVTAKLLERGRSTSSSSSS